MERISGTHGCCLGLFSPCSYFRIITHEPGRSAYISHLQRPYNISIHHASKIGITQKEVVSVQNPIDITDEK